MARVVGTDKDSDVAVLEIEDKNFDRSGLKELILADSDSAKEGGLVVALGAPFSLEASVTLGIISATGRNSLQITKWGEFIQTDAAINPGNSGGPLVNMNGKVIGINTAIFSKSGGYNGIGFAIPSNFVRRVATSLINDGMVNRGYIGVVIQPLVKEWLNSLGLPKNTQGVIVNQVSKGGPADKSGLKVNDIIVAVDGRKLKTNQDLVNIIGLKKPGTNAIISFYREGKLKKTELTIAKRPGSKSLTTREKQGKAQNKYGLMLETIKESEYWKSNKIISKQGLVIKGIEKKSPAHLAGLRVGDVITHLNLKSLGHISVKKFGSLINKKSMIVLSVERQKEFFIVELQKQKKD